MDHSHNHHTENIKAEPGKTENNDSVFYTCPMHPEIRQDRPGICPECGMNLIKKKPKKTPGSKTNDESAFAKASADKHAGHSTAMFIKKFWVGLALSVPVVLYSELPEKFFGWQVPAFPGSQYLSLVLSSIVFFYCGWIFIIGAIRELKARLPGMMTLIGLAVSAAYLFSVYATFTKSGHTLFWELTTLITIMLLGHWIEMRAVQGAQGALRELSKLLPDTVEVIKEGKTQIIPLSDIREGDVVFVRPGGKIPADGIVIDGKSDVNESMITGESKPVIKTISNEVIAGTINGDGALKIKITKIGEHTFLAGVMRLVQEAQTSKSRLQILSDKAAYFLTLLAIISGIITLIAWLITTGNPNFAIERLVAVLVITCPHALGLAVPLVASISTTIAARNGLLIRQRLALEAARKIDIVLFDKTGTLTKGEYGVEKSWAIGSTTEKELLELAASIDAHSEHFISRAIVAKAKENNITLEEVQNFSRIPGKGVSGFVDGHEIIVGGLPVLENAPPLTAELQEEIKKENKAGKTIIFVLKNKEIIGAFALADIIREESREAIQKLKQLGVKVAMITGDSEDVARWVAEELKIDEYFARVLPKDKSAKIKLLQERGLKVAMVGDGINDAPALTQADLGIAIGAGTNVAIESAGIILVRNDPRDIIKIIKLSRLTYSKMIQNLWWAAGYNIVALPLAAGILAPYGILLQPAVSALFMSFSTVIVALNALLLRRKSI
ncbi:MAG: heavy metal translocating P-type ATPase [bacterium]|nr:heavy metal translocating P-type ATPase [bacterium]